MYLIARSDLGLFFLFLISFTYIIIVFFFHGHTLLFNKIGLNLHHPSSTCIIDHLLPTSTNLYFFLCSIPEYTTLLLRSFMPNAELYDLLLAADLMIPYYLSFYKSSKLRATEINPFLTLAYSACNTLYTPSKPKIYGDAILSHLGMCACNTSSHFSL